MLPSLIPCKITFSHCISIFLNLSLIVVLISAIARALCVRTKTVLVLPEAIKDLDFLIRQLKPLLVTYYSLQKAIQYQSDLKIAKRTNLKYKKNQASSVRNRNNLNSKTKNPASQSQNTLNFGENTCKQLNIVSCFQA